MSLVAALAVLQALQFPPLPFCPRCAAWHVGAPCEPVR